jgi:microcystin-dependent protein
VSDPFIGELRLLPYNFAPRGWALCNGQVMSISQNTALFSLLGTTYGGNGQTTFALPDLRGRTPMSSGQGPGLSSYSLGEVGGAEAVTLNVNQMPAHGHQVNASSNDASSSQPEGNYPASVGSGAYRSDTDGTMNQGMVGASGGSQPHENRAPYLVLNWCIALEGIYPSRN